MRIFTYSVTQFELFNRWTFLCHDQKLFPDMSTKLPPRYGIPSASSQHFGLYPPFTAGEILHPDAGPPFSLSPSGIKKIRKLQDTALWPLERREKEKKSIKKPSTQPPLHANPSLSRIQRKERIEKGIPLNSAVQKRKRLRVTRKPNHPREPRAKVLFNQHQDDSLIDKYST